MSNEPPPTSKRWHPLQWIVVAVIVFVALVMVVPFYNRVSSKAPMMWSSSYARQIIILLKAYASDHGGKYPAGRSSNEVFRQLFASQLVDAETIFSCSDSPFQSDNKIGDPPAYVDALVHGENHWAMTGGFTDDSSGLAPLVFENPADTTWPPKWNMDAAGTPVRGRAWKSGRIVIARNDCSVAPEDLEAKTGARVGLKKNADGKDLFAQFSPTGVILDIDP